MVSLVPRFQSFKVSRTHKTLLLLYLYFRVLTSPPPPAPPQGDESQGAGGRYPYYMAFVARNAHYCRVSMKYKYLRMWYVVQFRFGPVPSDSALNCNMD